MKNLPSFEILNQKRQNAFVNRHNGVQGKDKQNMLKALGHINIDALMNDIVPNSIKMQEALDLPHALSEIDALKHLKDLAAENVEAVSFLGQGYYGTITPPVLKRNILENPGWYTAYTPYQPEISQGRLEAILNYQTMVTDLTGLDIANASLLDEATAAAEAMTLAKRHSKSKGNVFFIADNLHPQTIDILVARAEPLGIDIKIAPYTEATNQDNLFGAVFQYPATDGYVTNLEDLITTLKSKNVVVALATDLLALALLKTPADMGADIAFGSSQRFGVPMGFGGPHAAFFACQDVFKRSMPGRLVGVSVDTKGRKAYRLTLQTREQHIRREKATSNICTAQVLLAVMAGMYAVYHGQEGIKNIALYVHQLAKLAQKSLEEAGYELKHQVFFDTIAVHTGAKTKSILQKAEEKKMNFRVLDEQTLCLSFDETMSLDILKSALECFDTKLITQNIESDIPNNLYRSLDYLTHQVFNHYHSETEMMRYLRRLMDKDLALDRAMIPLGSCTMKLNAAAEMEAITWSAFSNIHPFAPHNQVQGYLRLIEKLEDMLCTVTGFDAVSLQPNSGAMGEFAGLMAIRGYHLANGDTHRTICLIPSSAHGTNPASAVMAGMDVVVVGCDENGNIDLNDLQTKINLYKNKLSALMVTYPSTHGVFEESIKDICKMVHDAGGQVYMDGANMNAQVGLTSPALIGADVCHLNLHKTFCIPHGGGGPGVGPIGVKAHLMPYLPGHYTLHTIDGIRHKRKYAPVAAAPFGSASILCISYAYILMMGAEGLKKATQIAILNANYVAKRLEPFYPILYKGKNDLVAHECILDVRGLKESLGITVDDIAKRLIDYGFHAPTMSWPVIGTLMVEPTESESKFEIDRFCDAMIAIYHEAKNIENGVYKHEQSPLANAPHTVECLTEEHWNRPYSRYEAVFPAGKTDNKYWTPVTRIDNVYGDRNVFCSCPPVEDFSKVAE